jgi:hypothetical protein
MYIQVPSNRYGGERNPPLRSDTRSRWYAPIPLLAAFRARVKQTIVASCRTWSRAVSDLNESQAFQPPDRGNSPSCYQVIGPAVIIIGSQHHPRHHHAEPWAGIAIVANLGWSCPRPAAIHEINRRARALAAASASASVRTAFGQPVRHLCLVEESVPPLEQNKRALAFGSEQDSHKIL